MLRRELSKLEKTRNTFFSSVSHDLKTPMTSIQGFIEGIPQGVISGGQYDNLMRKMKRKSKAIGFAVYLDGLNRLPAKASCAKD